MNRQRFCFVILTIALGVSLAATAAPASAQCSEVISGLRAPLGTTLTNQGNLLVSETGTTTLHSGRISIIDPSGNRRTLLDGLPSASTMSTNFGPSGIHSWHGLSMSPGTARRPAWPDVRTTIRIQSDCRQFLARLLAIHPPTLRRTSDLRLRR